MARILFLIIGYHKPSSKKRVLDSLEFLRARGHDVAVRELPKGFLPRLSLLPALRRCDLVVLQKKLLGWAQLKVLRWFTPRLVFDLDDAVMFHEIERNEPLNGKFFTRFVRTAAACNGVIAGNSYLAEFARLARRSGDTSSSVLVLPTPVDTDAMAPRSHASAEGGSVIGWMGTRGNLRHLLSIAAPLEKVFGLLGRGELRVISDGNPEMPRVPLTIRRWRVEDEADDLRGFDVGVMPLLDNPWTRGKGGFKLLQYMAAGVPAVASPVGINCDIIQDGENGFLARSESEWEDRLLRLMKEPDLRRRMGMAGRAAVEERFGLADYNRRLAELLEGLL